MTFVGTADMLQKNVIIYFHEIFLPAIQPGVDKGLGRVFKILVQHKDNSRLIGIIDYGIFNV